MQQRLDAIVEQLSAVRVSVGTLDAHVTAVLDRTVAAEARIADHEERLRRVERAWWAIAAVAAAGGGAGTVLARLI